MRYYVAFEKSCLATRRLSSPVCGRARPDKRLFAMLMPFRQESSSLWSSTTLKMATCRRPTPVLLRACRCICAAADCALKARQRPLDDDEPLLGVSCARV